MQNKPNLLNAQMNVRSSITMNYEQLTMNYANKNKPNQTQFAGRISTRPPAYHRLPTPPWKTALPL